MSASKCAVCNKTSYPLESINALEKVYHKSCFKCAVCKQSLNVKNFKGYEGKIYCATHTPKPNATTVTDSVAIKTALAAPKRTSEGLGTVQKGIGGKPTIQVFGGGEGEGDAGETSTSTSYEQASYEEPQEASYDQEPTYQEEEPQEAGDNYQEEEYTGDE